MRLVLTNDDGLHAPGIEALRRAVEPLGEAVLVAPDRELSGCGHQVTTHAPIEVRALAPDRHEVAGTPADCTRLALTELVPGAGAVLSGINAGGNLGVDAFISGTVAAAREAALLGVTGIAVSQYRRRGIPLDWERAGRLARRLVEEILAGICISGQTARAARNRPVRSFWNINLPALPPEAPDPEVVHCDLDLSPLQVRFRRCEDDKRGAPEDAVAYLFAGVYDERPRIPGRDIDVCLGGRIAVTRIALDVAPPG